MAERWQLKAVISANAAGMLKALKAVNAATNDTRKHLADVASTGGALAAVGGLSFAGMAYAATQAARSALNFAGGIQDAVDRTGAGVEEFQSLASLIESVGGTAEDAETAFKKFGVGVSAAARGKDQSFATLLSRMGVSLRNAKGEVIGLEDALPNIADSFMRTTNPATRLAMATELFGKSGTKLIPILAQGRSGVIEWRKEQERLGAILSKDGVSALDDLGDSLGTVGKQINTQIAVAVAGMSPMMLRAAKAMQEMVASNREWIQQDVVKYAGEFEAWVKQIDLKALAQGAKDVAGAFSGFIDMVGGAKNALIGFVVWVNLGTIGALTSLIGSLGKAALAFLAMAGRAYLAGNASLLALIRTAVVAVAVAGPLGALSAAFTWMGGAAAASGGVVAGAMGLVKMAIRGVGAAIMANPLGVILGLATAAFLIYENWDVLKKWFTSFFDWMGGKFEKMVEWASSLASSVGGFFGGDSPAIANSEATPLNAASTSLLMPQSKGRVDGAVNINIAGLPPGSRVEPASSGSMPMNIYAGFSSNAMGMP